MEKKILRKILTILIIIDSCTQISAQTFSGLNYNHAILNELEQQKKSGFKAEGDTVIIFETEFFEDFADYYYTVFPRPDRWEDRDAFINSTFAVEMISIGVATLDALDERGFPYYTSTNKVVLSDALTSLPFSFANDTVATTYFSFFYQAGGLGDVPEGNDTTGGAAGDGNDSLLLDFYDPGRMAWENVYFTLDNSSPEMFKQVIISVDSAFLRDGFRFRFRNYTSAESSNIQGQDLGYIANNDQWHIDYIRILTTTDSTELARINDITITKPLLPTLETYTAVPYHHYPFAQAVEERITIPLEFFVGFHDTVPPIQIFRNYRSYNLETGAQYRDISPDNNLPPNSKYQFEEFFTSGFQYDDFKNIGRFEVVAFLETDEYDQPLVNDTIRRKETYYDHYAYDDGSAEYSFGLGGEVQELNGMAVRFRSYPSMKEISALHGVLIYFAKSIGDASADAFFELSIYKNDGALPGSEPLYTSEAYLPDYSRGLNGFTRIPIDPPLEIADTFFVVIRQLNGYVGIGYDINTNHSDKIYTYSVTGEGFGWTPLNSGPTGSLMIRPSFEAHDIITPVPEIINPGISVSVYPNPAVNRIYVSVPDDDIMAYATFIIINIMGAPLLTFSEYSGGINISSLPPGIYFLQVIRAGTNLQQTVKFIKQ